ncbi:MAG: hypothetical protein Q9227_001656 [Pyrenula ochraceoflavens]
MALEALALEALLSKRPTKEAPKPKPNTRFLRNLIRETDSHNAALKKKEELEARMRAEGIPLAKSSSGQDNVIRKTAKRDRNSFLDDHEHNGRPRKRRRSTSRDKSLHGHRRVKGNKSYLSERRNYDVDSHTNSRSHTDKRGRRPRERSETPSESRSRSQSRERRHRTHHRRHGRHSKYDDHSKDHRHERQRVFSSASSPQSTQLLKYPTPRRQSTQGRFAQKEDSRGKSSRHDMPSFSASPSAAHSDSSTSDPLEDLVGPLPAVKRSTQPKDLPPVTSRGRGTYRASTSKMDAHFDAAYDPSLDMHPDLESENEKEDWDMALEALRDREVWKRKGAERLRAAGFGEDEVKKWEKSGKEKDAEDVRWASRGDKREWDIGKVVLDSPGPAKGEIGLEAAWKRKDNGFLKNFKQALE